MISGAALSLVTADECCLGKPVFARLLLDVAAGRTGRHPKTIRGECKQAEVIVMRSVAPRRARAAIARLPKIVDGLLQLAVVRGIFREFGRARRNVVGRPVMPRA